MEPMITYLVANYNNGRYIKDCIESLHAQSSAAWHCLIGDDKSTDDSLALIQPWLSDQVTLVTNDQNLGKSRTLTRLIDHAPTAIVGILDPDDALHPEATAAVLHAYRRAPQVGFVYTNFARYSADLQTMIAPGESAPIAPGRSALNDGYVGAMRTYRIQAYRQTTGYDPQILYAEDRDMVYKLEEVTPFLFIDQMLYKYRQVPASHTHAPAKRQLGIQNHRRAYHHALQRRKITGLRKWLHLAYFHERYSERRLTPAQLVPFARRVKHTLIDLFQAGNTKVMQ
jgi:glycosyltransferase involved in cell wall biosynthesis